MAAVAAAPAAAAPAAAVAEHNLIFRTALDAACVPDDVKAAADAIATREAAESAAAAKRLDEAWTEVERIIALNKEREAATARLKESLAAFGTQKFWNEDQVGDHFGLTPAVPPGGDDAPASMRLGAGDDDDDGAAGDAASAASTSPQRNGKDPHAHLRGRPKTLTGTSKASEAAHFAPASEKMAPIRRCFTKILRRREEIPREFTLLLNGLEELQHRVVPVEEKMSQSRFKLPLHVPFEAIARLINRTLIPQATGAPLEQWLADEIKPRMKELRRKYLALEEETDAKAIYGQLESEATERQRFHQLAMELIAEAVNVEGAMREAFGAGVAKVGEQCDSALRYVQDQATRVTDSSKALVEEVDAVERKGADAAAAELEQLQKQLKEAEFRAAKARRGQETYARQVREAIKSFKREQVTHEKAIAEAAAIHTRIARLEEAQRQFVAGCHERRTTLADAHEACLFVNDVIADVTAEVHAGLDLCRQHISRMQAEENFRKIRIAREPMDNAREWFRCVGDLRRIRGHRQADIRQRMEGSWQLEFLLSQEEQAHTAALELIDKDLAHIHAQWARLTSVLTDLAVHVPVLSQYDKDPDVVRMRAAFLAVEGIGKDKDMREAHRKLLLSEAQTMLLRELALPPIPPSRPSKNGNKSRATGVRHVPRPPSASASGDGDRPATATAAPGNNSAGAAASTETTSQTPRGTAASTTLPELRHRTR